MAPLPSDLRRLLERAVLKAREASEQAALAALTALSVARDKVPTGLLGEQRRLRNSLRARARQLGQGDQRDGFQPLVEEVAYEHWHRMLFARFLAENHLLMHPSGVPVTLEECAELAPDEGEADAWQLAARYASQMLPGIFRTDDPSMQVRFAPEGRNELESLLTELPPVVFTSDDALGWVYQFWQSKKKDEVNKSGQKIGGANLSPVTQLFTEDYMVRFLLENSLGAWWAARHPNSPLLKQWEYLRFKDDGTPAAGTFPGWPEHAAEITLMDPCCGSGHFLVAGFEMLRRMRTEEESLSESEAADAVLRDNVFGLELDPRCTQIATFALALAAWRFGGYRPLPIPNIACSGIPVKGQLKEWTKLGGDDVNLRAALERLYELFKNAPALGSLINPADVPLRDKMFTPNYSTVAPLLLKALSTERDSDDTITAVVGAAVEGVVKASKLLARQYTLVSTNVPYLGHKKQIETLKDFCTEYYPCAKADLATVFVERCLSLCTSSGSVALVTPQNWLFLGTYKNFRENLLKSQTWNSVVRLGAKAFQTQMWEFNVGLFVLTKAVPNIDHNFIGLDVTVLRTSTEKSISLRQLPIQITSQAAQLQNPDARVILDSIVTVSFLSDYAVCSSGMLAGDRNQFYKYFWELAELRSDWEFLQGSVTKTISFGGRSEVVFYQEGKGKLYQLAQSLKHLNHAVQNWQRGKELWNKKGVAISIMGKLPCSLYNGDIYDNNLVVICPKNPDYLPAIWAYCTSPEYHDAVRRIDQKLAVTTATFIKVPFDFTYWQKVADEIGPLPEPYSDDPTQWLFDGQIMTSREPLQTAVARLLGYHWPQQQTDKLDKYADEDGVACLPAIAGEPPTHERVRTLLAAAYGKDWANAQQESLLAAVGFDGKTLQDWLRDGFFEQHCRLFHNRPFIWHIWDGRKDGFSALVNYHKLDAARLNKLIYTYLGDWIKAQRHDSDQGVAGAETRLGAALELQKKLEVIRDGESPYDIYVRWKPINEQPIGWDPDINDGVRLNIRPFVTAGVLRSRFTINWNKDRGANPDGSERLNDRHCTIAEKQAAPQQMARKKARVK